MAGVRFFVLQVFTAVLCALGAIGSNATDTDRASEPPAESAKQVLVAVNEEPITEGDLQFLMLSRQVPEEMRPAARNAMLEQLIDRRLIRAFLKDRRAEATETQLQFRITRLYQLIRRGGGDPQEVLAKLGYDDQTLRRELALPLGWSNYVRRIVTPERVREYFHQHREEFDGTEVRASQILLGLPEQAGEEHERQATDKLERIRAEILAGKVPFAEAAAMHSEAPSSRKSGDLGFFPYRGKMPEAVTRVAFRLDVGEISNPFRTQFGVHLLQVTDRKPGDLSLEDARRNVLEELSDEIWDETVASLRSEAQIEYKAPLE